MWNLKEFDWELIEMFRDMSLLCRFWPLFWARFAFYQCDWSEIYQKCINDYCAPWYEILKNSIENLLRYLEICRFYVDFNHSFGQGLRSINAINLIFERNRDFIIIHRPAKFHENRLRTFWVNRRTDTHTDRYTPMKIIPLQKQSFWAR